MSNSLENTSSLQNLLINLTYLLILISVVGMIYSIALSSIAFGIALFVFLILIFFSKKLALYSTSLEKYILFYFIAEILASIFSVDQYASCINMKRLFLVMFLYIVLLVVNKETKLKVILVGLISAVALASLYEILLQVFFVERMTRLSLFQHYMTEGGIKMIVLLMLIPFLMNKLTPKDWRVYALICFIPIFLGLILTQTRSSWLGFIAGCTSIGILKYKNIIYLMILVVTLFLLFAPSDLRLRALSIFDPHLPSNLTRINMIETGWRMFIDRPLFGYGDIDLKKIYVTYTTPIDPAEGGHLHNNFITILVTLGFFGFVAIMALFIQIFRVEINVFKLIKSNWLLENVTLGGIATYIGFHINGLFEWNFGDHEIAVLLWISIGMVLVSRRLYESENK